jgi:hypothetical protein
VYLKLKEIYEQIYFVLEAVGSLGYLDMLRASAQSNSISPFSILADPMRSGADAALSPLCQADDKKIGKRYDDDSNWYFHNLNSIEIEKLEN